MRKLNPVALRPWTLPLIVLGLTVPIVFAIYVAGIPAGLMTAAATVGVIVVVAVRAKFDEAIEVAPATGDRFHLLLVALAPVEEPGPARAVAEIAEQGVRALGAASTHVRVLAPATNTAIAHWLSDVAEAQAAAQRRLAITLATLAAAGLDGDGRVGDADPVQAVEDLLRTTPAHEVVFSGADARAAAAAAEVRRRLDRPVRLLGEQE